MAARDAGHGVRRKVGALEEYVGRVDGNSALLPAHDSREPDRAGCVGDDEGLPIERDFPSVEQQQHFPRARHAHRDVPRQAPQVVGMQWLAELEHHVIRHVHDGTDGPEASAAQPFSHPQRRARSGIQALDDAACEARAGGRRLESDREPLTRGVCHGFERWRRHLACDDRRDLARDAQHRQHVAAIRRHVERQDRVVEGERIAQRRPGHEFVGQLEDALVLLRQPEFARGAKHAVRLDAAQLCPADHAAAGEPRTHDGQRCFHASADVGRPAYDLQHCRAAARDLADGQLVGVGVAVDREHLADHDALEVARGGLDRFNLEAAHGEARRES